MNLFGGLIGGLVGGLIGAAAWAGIGLGTGYEVGFVAWGIGALVGFGVMLGTRGRGAAAGGAMAVVLAIGSILLGKLAWVHFSVADYLDRDAMAISVLADVVIAEYEEQGRRVRIIPPGLNDEPTSIADEYPGYIWSEAQMRWDALSEAERQEMRAAPALANPDIYMVRIADTVVRQYVVDGKPVTWPEGMNFEMAWLRSHYPEDVWADAVAAWEAMEPAERDAFVADVKASETQQADAAIAALQAQATGQGFLYSFSPFDILWVVLAVGTAFKLGAGSSRAQTHPAMVEAGPMQGGESGES